MKRLRKTKEFCFTLAVLVIFVLLLLPSTSSAQNSRVTGTQEDLRYIANQLNQIAEDYLPGTPYEKTMDDLILMVGSMSEEESRYLKPLIPGMLANLQIFKDALSGLDKPQSKSVRLLAQAAGEFPNAEYPNMQVANIANVGLPALYDILELPAAIVSFVANGGVVSQQWTTTLVNALPLTCVTKLDENGNPVRTPDLTIQTLRVALQGAEALKEGANCVLEQVLTGLGFGANLKWLTIIPTGLWLVEKAIYENLTQCDAMISGAEASVAYQRLGHIHDDMGSLNSVVNTSVGDLTAIKNRLGTHDADMKAVLEKILANQAEIIKLLLTPEGKRPGFGKGGY